MVSSAVSAADGGSSLPPSEGASPLGSSYSDLSDASAPAARPVLQQALAQLEVRCHSKIAINRSTSSSVNDTRVTLKNICFIMPL